MNLYLTGPAGVSADRAFGAAGRRSPDARPDRGRLCRSGAGRGQGDAERRAGWRHHVRALRHFEAGTGRQPRWTLRQQLLRGCWLTTSQARDTAAGPCPPAQGPPHRFPVQSTRVRGLHEYTYTRPIPTARTAHACARALPADGARPRVADSTRGPDPCGVPSDIDSSRPRTTRRCGHGRVLPMVVPGVSNL